jgi:3-oxoacyl-[acyl-carrier-protein] synthase III
MNLTFKDIRISGILGIIPSNVSRFDDEISNYSHSTASALKLKKLMGYNEHRLAPKHVCTSDLIEFGARHLQEMGFLSPEEMDALVLVTETPDYVLPPTSSVLHGRLGFRDETYCVDINQGCNGYIYGLFQSMLLIQSGAARKVLLAVGDTLSHRVSPRDRNSYPLIGDAAALTVIEKAEGASPAFMAIRNRGSGYQALMIPAGHSRLPATDETRLEMEDGDGNIRNQEQLVMQGGDVFNFTQTVVPPFIEEIIDTAGFRKEEIDYFMLHQANAFILERIARTLGLPLSKLPNNIVGKYGNSSPATIPVAIADNLPGLSNKGKFCLCGFGVGLSWGGAVLDLGPLKFCEITEFRG